jgi:uncharacterized protein (TIGR04255 family)
MFSLENRCVYEKNQLAEVICQLRFPEILSIETQVPDAFQEAIRSVFPLYQARKEGIPGKQNTNYQFMTADGKFRVNLTSTFISLASTSYTCWEDFAAMLDLPLAAFIKIYKPALFNRIGLRYVNFISRKALSLEGVPFKELITPCYLGILNEEEVNEHTTVRSTVDADTAIRGGCRCKLHAGPGNVKRLGQADPEVKFILDLDLYMPGQVPVNLSAGALQTLHSQIYGIFRYAITDILHDAMEPR